MGFVIVLFIIFCLVVMFFAFIDECKCEEKKDQEQSEAMRSFGLTSVKANAEFLRNQNKG